MILEILGSSAVGTLLGGVFGWLTKREERENMKMKFDHEVNMLNAKTNASIEIAKMNIQQAEVAGKLMVEKVEAEAFTESQKATSPISEIIKSVIRPIILGILMYQTYQINSALVKLTGGIEVLPATDIVGLYKIVVLSIIGLTSTAVGWYFAARSSKQFDKLIDKWKM